MMFLRFCAGEFRNVERRRLFALLAFHNAVIPIGGNVKGRLPELYQAA